MPSELDHLTAHLDKNPGATEPAIQILVSKAWIKIPDEYLQILRYFDGAEGFVGASYLALWSAGEIIPSNDGYRVRELLPSVLLFGSSMGGAGYGFHERTDGTVIVEVPFDSMSMRDVVVRAKRFEEFLMFLREE